MKNNYSKKIIEKLTNIEKWKVKTNNKIDEFELYKLYKNIYIGNVFDIKRSRAAMSKENISNLQKSFQIMYLSVFK